LSISAHRQIYIDEILREVGSCFIPGWRRRGGDLENMSGLDDDDKEGREGGTIRAWWRVSCRPLGKWLPGSEWAQRGWFHSVIVFNPNEAGALCTPSAPLLTLPSSWPFVFVPEEMSLSLSPHPPVLIRKGPK
jgi:hypothetical protein